MTEKDLREVILALPMIRTLEMSDKDKRNAIAKVFPLALDEVTLAYDWDFTLDIATESTVADQADYVLKGNKNDCRDIVNLKYNGELIEKMGQVAYDEYMVDRSHTAISIWIPKGRVNNFPRVTIVATPSTADIDMEYRYRRKKITIADFPNEFDYVIMSAVVKQLVPAYSAQYYHDLKTMIDRHECGGGESDQIKQDRKIVQGNNRRSRLYGYGG